MQNDEDPVSGAPPELAPLSGLTILDFSQLLPGPYCTLLLADLGATIVKVEPPEGDPLRRWFSTEGKMSPLFAALNRGKQSVALNLRTDEGRAMALDLVRRCDALVEGFRPGVMERLGLGFSVASEVNPSIVYCSLTGYGQSGPMAGQPGHDLNYLALAGVLARTGQIGGPPIAPAVQVADIGGGSLMAGFSLLAALLARARGTHRGATHLDVSMVDGVMSWLQMDVATWSATGLDPARGGSLLNGGAPFYAVYATRDGEYMALGALEERFWATFCAAAGRPEWTARQFEQPTAQLAADLAALFASRSRSEWTSVFAGVDACCTPVLGWMESWADSHIKSRGMLASEPNEAPLLRHPVLWSGVAPRATGAAPPLNDHAPPL